MTHRTSMAARLLPVALITGLQACGGSDCCGPPQVAAVTVTPPTDTLGALDQTVQLTAVALDQFGHTVSGGFTWSTADASVASVSDVGLVTAVANGTVEVRASRDGVTGVAVLTVLQEAAQLVFRTEPPAAVEGQVPFGPVEVLVEDAAGHLVPHATVPVTLTLSTSPSGESLAGTTSATPVTGVATFSDLALAHPGEGFVLEASSGGLTPASSAPFRVRLTFAQVSAGGGHTCGVTVAGFAYCWGDNEDGQLGNATSSEPGSFTPSPVGGGLRFAQVEAGSAHTCGATTDHVGHCWGLGSLGRLGHGSNPGSRESPTAVAGGHAFTRVVPGSNHSCGITAGGAVWCWGRNSAGQLGDGTTTDSDVPVQVTGGHTFAQLGKRPVCGVTTGNDAYCWGAGANPPVAVASGLALIELQSGSGHFCGIGADADARCWGRNDFGQVGDGTVTHQGSPSVVAGGLLWAQISPGGAYTCGVTTGAVAYCWGWNGDGGLGDGTTTDRSTPVVVAGGLGFVQVSAAPGAHTCGVTTGGEAWCWGANEDGQLGDGTTTNRLTPVRVIQ